VDTPIFLHYRPFDDLDWPSILEVSSAALVLAPVTISELNEHKDEGAAKLRQRAAMALKKLETHWERGNPSELRRGVELFLQDVEPAIDYQSHQLDYRSQDDRLLASIIHFKKQNATAQVVLVTPDFGLKAKARRHGIAFRGLPDDLKLPEELDSDQKRIKQLERAVLELKRAVPDLQLVFSNGTDRLEITLEPPVTRTQDELEFEKEKIRQIHKKLPSNAEIAAASPWGLGVPSQEAIDEYNEKLEQFFKSYDRWITSQATTTNWNMRLVTLDLVLANGGTTPAEDIDIFLHFPDGFELFNDRDLPRMPEEPKPPRPPKTRWEGTADKLASLTSGTTLFGTAATLPMVPRNVSSPVIRRSNSYEVNVHVKQLKHMLQESLDSLHLVFKSYERASSFGFDYRIIAANVPQPVVGELHLIVNR
jgi:hypothetical protein